MTEQREAGRTPRRLWLISELVECIVKHCGPEHVMYQTGFGTLCVLARTCRALQEPALNIIWRQQNTLMNLVGCLPKDIWSVRQTLNESTDQIVQHLCLSNTRTIVPEDWNRFDFYAARVRTLAFREGLDEGASRASQDAYEVLRGVKGTSLLPNLGSVLLGIYSPVQSVKFLKAIASVTLTEINMVFGLIRPEEVTQFPEGLAALAAVSPNVRSLHFEICVGTRRVDFPTLTDALHLWTALQSTSCDIFTLEERLDSTGTSAINTQLLSQLSAIPKLSTLSISTSLPYSHVEIDDSPQPVTFDSLNSLTLHLTTESDAATALLGDFTFPSLQSLYLTATRTSILGVLPQLSTHVATASLCMLKLEVLAAVSSPDADAMVVGYAEVRPLTAFHNLTLLSLRAKGGTIELDDEAWEHLAPSWPALGYIEIADAKERNNGETPVRPTYKGLGHLIRHCRFLRFIAMTLRDADGPLTASDLEPLQMSTHLLSLQLRDSVFKDVESTLDWLDSMIPVRTQIVGLSFGQAGGEALELGTSTSELQELSSAVTRISENLVRRATIQRTVWNRLERSPIWS